MRFKRNREEYPKDLAEIIKLVDDMAFYRTLKDDGGLGTAAWVELRMALKKLPERPPVSVVAVRGLDRGRGHH